MADAKVPGDGKTNPFTQGGGQVAGNNFITNPRGSNTGSGGGRRFDNQQSGGQAPRESTADINEQDAAAGGRVPLADAQQTPGKDIGCGSMGNTYRPYRVG